MKKIFKKILCITLTATLFLSSGVSVAAASGTTTKKYQAAVAKYEKFTKKKTGNYKIIDIDKNGIPELLFHNGTSLKDEVYTYNYKKNKMVRLARISPGQNYMPGASYSGLSYRLSNKSFRVASATTGDVIEKYYKLSGKKIKTIAVFKAKRNASNLTWTYKINGKKVSQNKFLKKLNKMRNKYTVVLN